MNRSKLKQSLVTTEFIKRIRGKYAIYKDIYKDGSSDFFIGFRRENIMGDSWVEKIDDRNLSNTQKNQLKQAEGENDENN